MCLFLTLSPPTHFANPRRFWASPVLPDADRIRGQQSLGLMQPYLRVFHHPAVFPPPHGGLLPIEPRRLPLGGERDLDPLSQLFWGWCFPLALSSRSFSTVILWATSLTFDTSTLFVISRLLLAIWGKLLGSSKQQAP